MADHYCDPGEAVYDQKILFLSFDVGALLTVRALPPGALSGIRVP